MFIVRNIFLVEKRIIRFTETVCQFKRYRFVELNGIKKLLSISNGYDY